MKIIWEGTYSYIDVNENESGPAGFEIRAELQNGSFEGDADEEEFTGFTGDRLHVKGFIEDGFISFVKTYPYAYWHDNEGTVWTNKELPGHNVNYQGIFNETKSKWSGEWEILSIENRVGQYQEEYNIITYCGRWSMKQV